MIFAEKRHEGGEQGYFTTRYIVFNGDMIGSYGVHYTERGPYGASRDYHRLATEADYASLDDECSYVSIVGINTCEYHGYKACVCDGSSMVEIIDGDDERAFAIAAMMAGVER
jgi:hypothetical protein